MFNKVMKFNVHKISLIQNIYQTCYYCTKSETNTDVLLFFKQNLGLSENEIKKMCSKFPSFYNDSHAELSESFGQLMNFGFSREEIIRQIQILTVHPITVKNYFMLLEEGGFNKCRVDIKTLLRFKYISKNSIQVLKNEKYIHADINVSHHILSFTKFPQKLYPESYDDSISWAQVQRNMFHLYVNWKLQMDSGHVVSAQKIYNRLYNKSFRLTEKSIDIMLYELNFSKDKLKRNPYLIYSDPDNTQAIINNFKYLCGMDVKLLLNKHPKIILGSWKTIEQIKNHIEEFGIPESAIARAPELYTLGSKTVYERLCKLKETPELASFLNHPQVARLLYYFKKVNFRLNYLTNKNCLSLNLLVTNDSKFNRFNCNGTDKGRTNDTMMYLTKEFGANKTKLRSYLERHPYWQYISLLTIRTTYEFLKTKHFTNDQICHCIHILLYPVSRVEDALKTTENMINISYLRNSSGSIKSEYILSLALYNLERYYHFSGNGVWNTSEQDMNISISDSSNDTEELDHKPSTKLLL
ncbi:Hypothetical protein CINCED_3A022223 [Cinara cedri]|uniref:Transcription termination factor 5, mitochondrial n=1 Tax=Cinara cedri TaxID=506608 RepID=A0A5E4NMS7_9HEMI|nr:Hypothetical protein CINCED_3A022223 [Cinara cedri]